MIIFLAGAMEARGFQYIKEVFDCCFFCNLTPDSDSRENICQFLAYLTTDRGMVVLYKMQGTCCYFPFQMFCRYVTMHTSLT